MKLKWSYDQPYGILTAYMANGQIRFTICKEGKIYRLETITPEDLILDYRRYSSPEKAKRAAEEAAEGFKRYETKIGNLRTR